jgi:tRNA(Ile)-lysidine synthase
LFLCHLQMNISQHFKKIFSKHQLPIGNRYLLAVSGGIDSVVLCELSRQSEFNFAIAHCNFQLREEESERDENFVRGLESKYGVQVFVKKFDTQQYAEEKSLSIQEAARELRYAWFAQLQSEHGFAYTLLAHHADDNIETLLMNFFRGTGLQGLTGIPESNPNILRPMLDIRRQDIIEFARENNLQWVEDSSNSSSKYTRNFFRNELIPAIQKVYPNADENLLRNIERMKKINGLYQESVEQLKRKILEVHSTETRIPVKKLLAYRHTSLIFEIIKDFGFNEKQVDEVLKLADAGSGKFIENDRYQLIKQGNWFIMAGKSIPRETIAIDRDVDAVELAGKRMLLQFIPGEKFQLRKSELIAQLDAKKIEFPLLVRKWKQGDYFYPLGMLKKKKLSRFFIDQKLPKNQKENVWVLESNKKIIWVAGMRIDERFKITSATKQVLLITFDR